MPPNLVISEDISAPFLHRIDRRNFVIVTQPITKHKCTIHIPVRETPTKVITTTHCVLATVWHKCSLQANGKSMVALHTEGQNRYPHFSIASVSSHNFLAISSSSPNTDVLASWQSEKYFPLTFSNAGLVATTHVVAAPCRREGCMVPRTHTHARTHARTHTHTFTRTHTHRDSRAHSHMHMP